MAAEGTGPRVVRNTLLLGVSSTAGVLVTLFLTPLLIDRLGATEYGVWALATSLSFSLGYLSFAELGIEQSAVRYIAEARSDRDVRRVAEVVSSTLAIYLVVAAVAAPLLVLLAGPLSELFNIPAGLEDDARLAFAIIGAQLALDLPSRTFAALLQGVQQIGLLQLVELGRTVATAVALAAVAIAGYGVVGLAVASAGVAVVATVAYATVALLTVRGTEIRPHHVHRSVVRELVTFGGQLLLFRVWGLVYRQMDRTILGIMATPVAVTRFEIASRMHAAASMVEVVATSALVPAAAFNRRSRELLQDMLLRGASYAIAAVLPVIAAAFVFAGPLIATWIDPRFEDTAGAVRLLMAVLVLSVVMSVGQQILSGLGHIRGLLVLAGIWIVLNIPLSILLVGPLGVEGVILGTLISQTIVFGPTMAIILRRLEVPPTRFARRALAPQLPALALQALAALALLPLAEDTGSLVVVALLALASCLVSWASYVLVGLRGDDRSALLRTLRAALPARG